MDSLSGRIEQLTPLQRALFVLRETQAKLDELRRAQSEPIAIVGMSCRFPGGVHDPRSYWRLLCDKTDAITEVPADRWDINAYYDPDPQAPGKMNTRWGGFLDRVQDFDPLFFGISRQEATHMDPQQRLLLELAWEALEDGGIPAESLRGAPVGVFVGISFSEYGMMLNTGETPADPFIPTGSALSIAANRLSFLFDFRGPSLAIDTACSSSLVAVQLACQSIRSGESSLALAGGANLILSPSINVNLTKGGFLAADGRCRTFDARASGYVRSEGAALIVLKPMAAAVANGDPIYAVIRGGAVNQDGTSNGLTAPNRMAQENVLREAYAKAQVSPGKVRYVEAHGTGTPLGDPIEARALAAVLGVDRPADRPCVLGAVKANIGHTEAAAGVAGLIKVALSLQHRQLPGTVHYSQPNPNIPFDELPLKVQQTLGPWPDGDGPLLAGVSSFGFGGTNSHMVVEEAPAMPEQTKSQAPARSMHLLPLSARSEEALEALAQKFSVFLQAAAPDPAAFQNILYSACVRRDHHDHRLALVIDSAEQAIAYLNAYGRGENRPGLCAGRKVPGRRSRLAFVFSGQGPQWWAMGRQLLEREPDFRATLEQCDRLLTDAGAPWSLLEELGAAEPNSRMGRTEIAQPALVAIQIGLAALWKSWGIVPHSVVGHSLGEVAAAHVAGALTLAEAMRIIFHRGRLMQQTAGQGKTAAVELGHEEVRRLVGGMAISVEIAAINSPASTTISGSGPAVDAVVEMFKQRGVQATPLRVDCAFHSVQMEPLRAEMQQALAGIQPRATAIALYSTVTGRLSTGTECDPSYWGRNLREPVLFAESIARLVEKHHDVFLEIAPHPVLAGAIGQCLRQHGHEAAVLHSLRRHEDEQNIMLRALAELYVRGYAVDWRQLGPAGRFVRLPTYPWQNESYWFDFKKTASAPIAECAWGNGPVRHPLLARHLRLAQPANGHVWETDIDAAKLPFSDSYRLDGSIMVPGTALVEMATAAAEEVYRNRICTPEEIDFPTALFLPDPGTGVLQVILTPRHDGETAFDVYSRIDVLPGNDSPWTLHATGKIILGPAGVNASAARAGASGG